jgi:hypothetical protein
MPHSWYTHAAIHFTLWWSSLVQQVTTVEHSEPTAPIRSPQTPAYVELEPGGEYGRAPAATGALYDLIAIDGRNRVTCGLHSISTLADRSVLILDNSERRRYAAGRAALAKAAFKHLDFSGLAPLATAWQTRSSIVQGFVWIPQMWLQMGVPVGAF